MHVETSKRYEVHREAIICDCFVGRRNCRNVESEAARSQRGIGFDTNVRHNLNLHSFFLFTVFCSQQTELKDGYSKMEKELFWCV